MTVRELEHRMDAREFMEWVALQRVDALPDPWLQTGVIAATVANSNRVKGPPRKPTEFIPRRPKPRQSVAEMMRAMASIRT
jgi:hypothetical protein